MAITVVQVSDSHLSPTSERHVGNWCHFLAHLRADPPDLVVSTGDVSLDGAGSYGDLAYAAGLHRRLPVPWRAVPGNHDVGEEPGSVVTGQAAGRERWARWQAAFGSSRWAVALDGWVLVGLDCSVLGTGTPAEAVQWAWFETTLQRAAGPIGLFLHKPIVLEDPAEPPDPTWTVHPASRPALLGLVEQAGVRFVASGHLHQHRLSAGGATTTAWCPSTAFVTHHPRPGATPVLGWLQWTLDGPDATAALVAPPELATGGS